MNSKHARRLEPGTLLRYSRGLGTTKIVEFIAYADACDAADLELEAKHVDSYAPGARILVRDRLAQVGPGGRPTISTRPANVRLLAPSDVALAVCRRTSRGLCEAAGNGASSISWEIQHARIVLVNTLRALDELEKLLHDAVLSGQVAAESEVKR